MLTITFLDTFLTQDSIFVGIDATIGSLSVNSVFAASLFSPPAIRVRTKPLDLWSAVKVPLFDALNTSVQDGDGVVVDPANVQLYSSLLGVLTSLFRTNIFQATLTLNITNMIVRCQDPIIAPIATFPSPQGYTTFTLEAAPFNITVDTEVSLTFIPQSPIRPNGLAYNCSVTADFLPRSSVRWAVAPLHASNASSIPYRVFHFSSKSTPSGRTSARTSQRA
jgi:hypothetical protein